MFAPRGFAHRGEDNELDAGCQARPLFNSSFAAVSLFPPVQPKLKLGPVRDQYEQEADRVADQVVDAIPFLEQNTVMGQETGDRLDLEKAIDLRRKVAGDGFADIADFGPDLDSAIQVVRGTGQLLSDRVRQPMERAFSADFSGVRIHTDARADMLNRSIQARAFTTGQDIFLRQGTYEPGRRDGLELIAHELTHVMQQNGGRVRLSSEEMKKTENNATQIYTKTEEHRASIQFNKSKDLIQRSIMRITNNGIELVMTDEARNHIWERHGPHVKFEGTEQQSLFAPIFVPEKGSLDQVAERVFLDGENKEFIGKDVAKRVEYYYNFRIQTGYGDDNDIEGSFKGVRMITVLDENEANRPPGKIFVETMYPVGDFISFDEEPYEGGIHSQPYDPYFPSDYPSGYK
jgi:hypothetical protein